MDIYAKFIQIIESTLRNESGLFDLTTLKVASGLIQDTCNSLNTEVSAFLDQLLNILFFILENETYPRDV
jgi:hypothetical protein